MNNTQNFDILATVF